MKKVAALFLFCVAGTADAAEYVCSVSMQPAEFAGAQVHNIIFVQLNTGPNCSGAATNGYALCGMSAAAAGYPNCAKGAAYSEDQLNHLHTALAAAADRGNQVGPNVVPCNSGANACVSTIGLTGKK